MKATYLKCVDCNARRCIKDENLQQLVVTDVKKTRSHECTGSSNSYGNKSNDVRLLLGLMTAVRSKFDSITNIYREYSSTLSGVDRVLLGELRHNCESHIFY